MPALTAREVSLKSREYVHARNKEGWLGLFDGNAVIEDPIGPSYLDPEGVGHGTPALREAFWDNNIANSNINITIHQSYCVGTECANHVTLLMGFEHEGKAMQQEINGVFTYHVNEDGKLLSLRGFWEVDVAMKTLAPASEA